MHALATVVASFPSPPANGISVGPLKLHIYGLCIAAGIAVAVVVAQRRWETIGGKSGTMITLAVWGVPGGLIGARLYSVLTSYQDDTGGHFWRVFAVWQGGLGIWGAVVGGVATGLMGAHRHRLRTAPLLDCVALAFPLAQGVGRLGNYFNQELFGKPSGLPWAVRIDAAHRPAAYLSATAFQPTFLYEMIWDGFSFVVVLLVARHVRLRRGYLFAVYAMAYTVGRFWIEYLRIDPAHKYGPFRLNDYTSIVVFAAAAAIVVIKGRPKPGDDLVSDSLLEGDAVSTKADAPTGP
ncbi:MAG: prolipoprotein diacylglyceryl transferase [Actinomycetota bacterium]|nr:prolipoprotein diacylglyceryl transferase [Actinomycetota bacterium]